MKPAKNASAEQKFSNPTLHPDALVAAERGASFKWHKYAHSPRSSQAFCLSAFGTLRGLDTKDQILNGLFHRALPGVAASTHWAIEPEAERPELLTEFAVNQQASTLSALQATA